MKKVITESLIFYRLLRSVRYISPQGCSGWSEVTCRNEASVQTSDNATRQLEYDQFCSGAERTQLVERLLTFKVFCSLDNRPLNYCSLSRAALC